MTMQQLLVITTLICCYMIVGVTSFILPTPGHENVFTSCIMSKQLIAAVNKVPSDRMRLLLQVQQQPKSSLEETSEEKELTPSTIAEMIEVSFIQSCLQLSQGYVDVLKLFIVAVKAGYERSIPLNELHKLVQDCPVNSAGRDLMPEEKALRLEWMMMVYELLNALNPDTSVDSSIVDGKEGEEKRISQIVQGMLAIQSDLQHEEVQTGGQKDATVTLTNLTVEQALEFSELLSKLNKSISDAVEKAFFTNDVRVGLMTFRVLQEEKICMQGSSGNTSSSGSEQVPRPPIPGT